MKKSACAVWTADCAPGAHHERGRPGKAEAADLSLGQLAVREACDVVLGVDEAQLLVGGGLGQQGVRFVNRSVGDEPVAHALVLGDREAVTLADVAVVTRCVGDLHGQIIPCASKPNGRPAFFLLAGRFTHEL